MRWRGLVVVVASGLVACLPKDPRKPAQPPAPEVAAVPAPEEPVAPAPAPAPAPEPKRELLDGAEDARLMLEVPQWDDAQRFATYCADSIARATAVRDRLRGEQADAAKTAADFDQLSRELDTAGGLASLMFNANPNEDYRKAAEKCEQDIQKFATEVSLDRGLYDALAKVDVEALDALGKRFVDKSLRDFRRAGVDKDDATRARIAEINARLVELEQSYIKNISDDTRSIEIPAADAGKLSGLPQDWLDAHKPNDAGNIVVTTDYPDFFPFATYVADDALRKALYVQFLTRAYPKNKEILTEVLTLRAEKAKILGFPDWAHYAIEDKMAGSAETVQQFLGDITEIIRPRADADLAVLLARKQKDLPEATAIETYDRFYYVAAVQKENFKFDPQSVRPYFSYPAVKAGILSLYGNLFGLEFKRLEDAKTWAPGVEAYEMLADGTVIGRFFLDMHPRAGKYKHAAAFEIQSGDSGTRIPYASLVCNFPNPADGDGKALMEHNDVVTFFHEFGHLIHHLLARKSAYIDLNGFNTEWDFVEAPSQLLEEWAWSPEVLQGFAKHVDTGEAIPTELVEKMKAADEFGKGLHLMRQVFYTSLSFYLHEADPATLDLDAFMADLYTKFSPFPQTPGTYVYANFGHLMGYTALYYTYQWSLAISKDLFTRFKAEGILNSEVAQAYRKAVLEMGGAEDAKDMVEHFLGRARNLDAYKKWIQEQ
ncbi:MAG: peptidase M3 [Deltaproteobacteria bacterium]|nr:MAG: peptidase M3 [Deltaproteobacteria bacterium]